MNIHIITGEYPPDCGGVADYSSLVAAGLSAAGESVHVWCSGNESDREDDDGVLIHRCCGSFDRAGLERLSTGLDAQPQPRRLIVQYVPHAFSPRAMNLRFIAWLWRRRRVHGDVVDVVFHELAFPFVRHPLKHNLIAIVNRLMLWGLLLIVRHVYVSTAAWLPMVSRYSLRRLDPQCCPVPSNVPFIDDQSRVQALRSQLVPVPSAEVLGHFGTYSAPITNILTPLFEQLLASRPRLRIVLLGRHSLAFRHQLVEKYPEWSNRIAAVENLSAPELSIHLQLCDVLFQPYPDGATTRRGSLMAALSHGKATLTTYGKLSEKIWQSDAITPMVDVEDFHGMMHWLTALLDSSDLRDEWGMRGQAYYSDHFSLDRTVQALLKTFDKNLCDVSR